MARKDNIVVGLDIGTTKICAIVGEIKSEGMEIIGIGTQPSKGLRKGVVVNIDATVQSIKKAIEEAELMAGCEINMAYVGIAGGHIKGFNSHGVIAVKDREITKADIARVIEAAQAITIPTDREVIHVIPQEYILDEQDGIQEPLGMTGVRLEARVHIVTAAVTSAQNIIKSVNKAGLNVADVVLQQIASSEAVLGQDEKDIGVALVDIGGGTTDIAIYHGGTIKHTAVISIGGNQVTGDISVGIRTPSEEAEKIKKKYGCCMTSMIDKNETIEVPGVGGRKSRIISRQILGEIIEPRIDELFQLVNQEIVRAGCDNIIASGIVLTGGTASMEGIVELGEQVFNLPVRRGLPSGIGGLVDVVKSPMYSTGVGLVLYARKHAATAMFERGDRQTFNKLFDRMKGWIKEFF
ncbi:MAG: cell division protein FtsA [Deltaproteobacteria bacterium GWC2_42_51]|nr:MAG: cell division protein FtsA [Deltaproteobacteria bacterium GWA2_42_85]OGP28869.1 MAG: cell division protein FtsA [Deltaproteobacteria bacterium GWB2_42_7]OGP31066.1 MAG: cell division protein FtsA [Deltaproteobacteria bacterium GWC2_42_51]OGP43749.1 MAG: cell division protein FtsA [Deltaproteobacteria bacterium GWD2_42_10]OGP46065.1 MAG: cell division protein FtsA [Deltaproteobacteria bacterium GWF2_42_12]OGQ23889.1 MAG: cell division protein FtsA [Deltaproteobacteria bacterium RIFCSPHI